MASDQLERDLTHSAVGYLSKEDYKRKREDMEQDKALQALKRMAGVAAPAAGAGGGEGVESSSKPPSDKKVVKKKKDKEQRRLPALSFDDELEQEEERVSPGAVVHGGMAAARAKEEQQAAARQEAAMREALQQQRAAKAEPLTLHFTFRSELTQRELPGAVHRGAVSIKRGFSAEEAAVAVRTEVEKLGGKFAPNAVQGVREERDVVLVCCCEGMSHGSYVIPGAVGLTELWARRWSDSNAPMCVPYDGVEHALPTNRPFRLCAHGRSFVCLAAFPGRFDELKHGVVVTERRWFESQRHTYPYSHWRMYDTLQQYELKTFVANRDKPAQVFEPRRESKAKGK